MKRVSKYSYFTLIGHIATDLTQGGIPALLPFLIAERHYSYAAAGGIVLAGNLLSAITQPLFGHIGDKKQMPWVMPVGILLAGGAASLIGWMDSYLLICLCCFVMGVGVSLFHPEGSKLANIVSGENKGIGMAMFSVGGNIGFSAGPILVTLAVSKFGLKGTSVFIFPAIIAVCLLAPKLKEFKELELAHKEKITAAAQSGGEQNNVKGFAAVSIVVLFRSIAMAALNMFVPLFWVGIFAATETEGNLRLSIYATTGIVASLLGGRIADAVGYKILYRTCSIAAPPLLLAFAFAPSPGIATALIVLIAFAVAGSHSAFIATGQSFMPHKMGTASGVLFGLTVSMGGMCAPLVGKIGDTFGLRAVMLTVFAISLAAFAAMWFIPERKKHKTIEPKGAI